MKISLYGMPNRLLNSYCRLFDMEKGLLQVLDMNDYCLYVLPYSIRHSEVMRLMYNLSRIMYFDTLYLYNVLFDNSSELYIGNEEISFNLNFDENRNLNTRDYDNFFHRKTAIPWFFPYDKVLIPSLRDLDFFMVDIEEVSLSFLLVKKYIDKFSNIQKEILSVTNSSETIKYIKSQPFDDRLKSKIMNLISNRKCQ